MKNKIINTIKRNRGLKKYTKRISSTKDDRYLNILLLCHALEKGMGVRDVKRAYGFEKADTLIKELKSINEDQERNKYEFQEALAVLKAYFEYQESQGIDVSKLRENAEALMRYSRDIYQGGYRIIDRVELTKGMSVDLPLLLETRHSMRNLSKDPVNDEEILRAVHYAKKAPSACNREPWKFYYSLDYDESRKIASAIPAQSFLNDIPYYGVVTVDRGLFKMGELNQWYTNGGIFLAYLTLTLHNMGIGSCIFQYTVFSDTMVKLKEDTGICENEEIIAVIGFGKYMDQTKCIIADRRPDTEIAVNIHNIKASSKVTKLIED